MDGWSVDLLCSRNARPQKALVGRAQWEINRPPAMGDESFRNFVWMQSEDLDSRYVGEVNDSPKLSCAIRHVP